MRIGRTHGVQQPDVWGHRVTDLGFAMGRSRDRLREPGTAVAAASTPEPSGRTPDRSVGRVRRRRRARASRGRAPPRSSCGPPSASGSPRSGSSPRSPRRSHSRCGTASGPRCGSCRRRLAKARRVHRDAAQKEPDPVGAHRRPARWSCGGDHSGHRGHPALARARHLALVGGTVLPNAAIATDYVLTSRRAHRGPGSRRSADAGQPGVDRRTHLYVVGAAGPGRRRAIREDSLPAYPGRSDGDLADRRRPARP